LFGPKVEYAGTQLHCSLKQRGPPVETFFFSLIIAALGNLPFFRLTFLFLFFLVMAVLCNADKVAVLLETLFRLRK
jgi:hypothetical protein